MPEPPSPGSRNGASVEDGRPCVTVAIPCRADEPSLGHVVDEVLANCRRATFSRASAIELLVCINGVSPSGECMPLSAVRERCAVLGIPLTEIPVDGAPWPTAAPVEVPLSARVFLTSIDGKARAWNLLRAAAAGDPVFMCDADVTFSSDAVYLKWTHLTYP